MGKPDKEPEKKENKKKLIFDSKNKKDPNKPGGGKYRNFTFIIFLVVLAFVLYNIKSNITPAPVRIPYSAFVKLTNDSAIAPFISAEISNTESGLEFTGKFLSPAAAREAAEIILASGITPAAQREIENNTTFTFSTTLITITDNMLQKWENSGMRIVFKKSGIAFTSILLSLLPWIVIIAFWLFIMRQMQGGGGGQRGLFSFGKSKARVISPEKRKITFVDVAGVDEAKIELKEIIDYLRRPDKFQKLGGKIPKGVLLLGPPGTGKTLLARAVAGEAEVPFFSMSGSDFVEMFVGVGASRVRDIFEQGKKNAPCIIFVDEIDAVGRHRGAGLGGGHDEREQTLNQLLVEMDGFEENSGVILIAATNRPDVLDPALLRPGRFDRQVVVDRPDIKGREGILKVHTKNIPLDDDVDLNKMARGTPGFSGADIANMVNEAALLAARFNQEKVSPQDFEEARDKVMMGTERSSLVISDEEKNLTAIHEAGHAVIHLFHEFTEPLHKVTIIPRGMAMGVTFSLPLEDKHSYSKEYMLGQICAMMGGRVAEEMFLHSISSGASNDIKQATKIARRMVCNYGMSDKLGTIAYGQTQGHVFLGKEMSHHQDYSEKTAQLIDSEVKQIIDTQREKTRQMLEEHREEVKNLADALLIHELLDKEEIERILKGEEIISAKKTRKLEIEKIEKEMEEERKKIREKKEKEKEKEKKEQEKGNGQRGGGFDEKA
ncbi:MAG: ATP-dependent zinc metalloprotease FtsH [Fibrobacterota bacterium]